jgi:hypothetical protein
MDDQNKFGGVIMGEPFGRRAAAFLVCLQGGGRYAVTLLDKDGVLAGSLSPTE